MQNTALILLCSISILLICESGVADSTTENNAAVQQTQTVLRDSTARQNVINHSSDAKNADAYAQKVLGSSQNVNQAYDITAALMPWITAQSNGDPAKMQALLNDALRDPEAFLNRMPAAERARIKALSAAAPQPTRP